MLSVASPRTIDRFFASSLEDFSTETEVSCETARACVCSVYKEQCVQCGACRVSCVHVLYDWTCTTRRIPTRYTHTYTCMRTCACMCIGRACVSCPTCGRLSVTCTTRDLNETAEEKSSETDREARQQSQRAQRSRCCFGDVLSTYVHGVCIVRPSVPCDVVLVPRR